MKKLICGAAMAVAAVSLSGCGTVSPNSDVGVVHIAGRQTVAEVTTVATTETGPEATDKNQNVVGTSCRNKVWDPEPSRDNAINLLKQQAASRGYNAVHSLQVQPDDAAILKNCWSSLVATGVAYRLP